MGKRRFRLSHMIPNAWFYRLRDMNTASLITHNNKNNNKNNNNKAPRQSTTAVCYTPTCSGTRRTKRRPYSCVPEHVLGSIYIPTESSPTTSQHLFLNSPAAAAYSSSCYESPALSHSSIPCHICNDDVKVFKFSDTKTTEDSSDEPDNPRRRRKLINPVLFPEEKMMFSGTDCCIVKSTFEPLKDLKESMIDMIIDYNIRAYEDLEKLLAFYLSLNSNEYHYMIVKAFKDTCFAFDFLV